MVMALMVCWYPRQISNGTNSLAPCRWLWLSWWAGTSSDFKRSRAEKVGVKVISRVRVIIESSLVTSTKNNMNQLPLFKPRCALFIQ
jgi:hypothetical protein